MRTTLRQFAECVTVIISAVLFVWGLAMILHALNVF